MCRSEGDGGLVVPGVVEETEVDVIGSRDFKFLGADIYKLKIYSA